MSEVATLARLAWPQVAERARDGAVLVVPVGSCEQHGHHLPLTTDADLAEALAGRLAARAAVDDELPSIVIAPVVAYGSSGEHDGFAGTLSIGREATRLLLVELVRSARRTFDRVLLVSTHGGNAAPVAAAVGTLVAEGHDVLAWSPRLHGDAHAGRTETSLQLALRPGVVGTDRRPGATAPLDELWPRLRAEGVRAVSGSGVLGDPGGASADEGHDLLDGATDDLVATVRGWRSAVVG